MVACGTVGEDGTKATNSLIVRVRGDDQHALTPGPSEGTRSVATAEFRPRPEDLAIQGFDHRVGDSPREGAGKSFIQRHNPHP
jgi:hypothetical protein